ncbi:cytoskeleton-associated protein 2 isoform 2-T2 [Leptodactylus fuscus]|uniref:cytoskeleton-associated protein 2 isoform X2 n=1 Tax=Leptodactylus fuscus TaxID=238119 RepID=UPI003F4F20EC
MSVSTVQPLPHSRRQQPGNREVSITKKTAAQKARVAERRPDIRSPLTERSNLQKKPDQVKNIPKKMAEAVNKENIRPAITRDGKSVTFTQSFLKTKTLKEKQMKDEKAKLESKKEEPKPATKPILGTYRGKVVQSKINSFWKNSENKNLAEQNITVKSQVQRPQSSASVPAKTVVRSSTNVKPKRPVIPPVSSQARPSATLTKSGVEPVTVRRTTQVLIQQRTMQQKTQPAKPPLKNGVVKSNPVIQSTKPSSGPVKTLPDPQKNKPAPKLPTACKFPRAKESAEERKARLAEWRQSKGKVIKRPPMAVVLPSTYNIQKKEPNVKTEPEEPKEETRQLYWATMAEEDERELFTLKLIQIFRDCQKLIDEGCPKEEVLSVLEKQIETVPEAKKLSGYWECLARLEKRDGQLYNVIAVCEEAVSAGAQPLEELRAILADALEQLKPDPVKEESVKQENGEDLKSEELQTEVKDEPLEKTAKGRRRRGRVAAMKSEPESQSTPDKPPRSDGTPEHGGAASSVIRFNVRSTPHLEKMKKLQLNEGDSSVKSYKFLTPVRRSSRLERKSHRLPEMLKDHDPCVSDIDQLGELEDSETCANAYIFRKNSALNEVSAKSATKKGVASSD